MEGALKELEERYEIGVNIGRKGPNQVYRGYDHTIGRKVSILRADPEGGRGATELIEDSLALASIQHPNFVSVYDFGEDKVGPYVVTEWLRGVLLERALEKSTLAPEDFIELVRQTLEALIGFHAGESRPVHIEPWNVLLVRQPGIPFVVKILGLGCHRVRRGKGGGGERNAECLALGRLYYQALTGVRPFGDIDTVRLAGKPLLEEFPSCRELNPEVPEVLSDWITWLIRDADANPDVTSVGLLDEFLSQIGEERRSAGIGHAVEGHAEGFDELLNRIEGSAEGDAERESKMEGELAAKQEVESTTLIPGDFLKGWKAGGRGPESAVHLSNVEGETEVIPGLRKEGPAKRVAAEGVMLTPDDLEFLSHAAASLSSQFAKGMTFPGLEDRETSAPGETAPAGQSADPREAEKAFTSVSPIAIVKDSSGEVHPPEVALPGEQAPEASVQTAAEVEAAALSPETPELLDEPVAEAPLLDESVEAPLTRRGRPQWLITAALMLGVTACVLVIAVVSHYLAALGSKDVPTEVAPEPAEATGGAPAKIEKSESGSMPASPSAKGPAVAVFLSNGKAATPEKAASSILAMMPGENFGGSSSEGLSVGEVTLDGLLSRARAAERQGDDLTAFSEYIAAVERFPRDEEALDALTIFAGSLDSRPPDVIDLLEEKLVQSAEYGVADAMRILGERAYALEDWEAAADWFRKASLKDDVRSKVFLGLLLVQGRGVERHVEEAAQLFEWAAKRGDQNGLYLAGECYVIGRGVAQDPARGLEYLEAAAELGDLRALDLIGVCHVRGLGREQNYEKALSYFRTAAKNGHTGAIANLGVLYMNGQGVEKDPAMAADYFRTGAESENAHCMYLYARCLEEGLGVDRDAEAAAEWYRKAVLAGSSEARERLATNGDGLAR